MNRLALALVLASVSCQKDTSPTTSPDANAVASTATPTEAAPPTTDPAPAEPTRTDAGAAEIPTDEPDDSSTIPTGPAKPIADPADGLTEPKDFALVKLELKQPNKKVYKDATGVVVEWSVPTNIDVDFDGHKHAFVVTAKRSGKSGVSIEIDYKLDGAEVVRSADLESKLKERGVLRVDDGTAIALTIANKRVKPKAAPAKDTIEHPTGTDPISGTEKKG